MESPNAASVGSCHGGWKEMEQFFGFPFCHMDSLFRLPLWTVKFLSLGGYAETAAVLVLGVSHLKCKLMMMRPEYTRFQEDSNPHNLWYKIDDSLLTDELCMMNKPFLNKVK